MYSSGHGLMKGCGVDQPEEKDQPFANLGTGRIFDSCIMHR